MRADLWCVTCAFACWARDAVKGIPAVLWQQLAAALSCWLPWWAAGVRKCFMLLPCICLTCCPSCCCDQQSVQVPVPTRLCLCDGTATILC
jgi:hypothetical protein